MNAAVVVALAVACSYLFTAFYTYRCDRAIHMVILAAFAAPVILLVIYVAVGSGADWVATTVIAWNLGAGAAWAIVYSNEHRLSVTKPAVVGTSVALAWPLMCLDELTLWMSLAGLAIWDIFAVAAPCGAFRLIIMQQQLRRWRAESYELPPGLLYDTDSGFSLGTGDFLLYGVLVGRASMHGLAAAAAACLGMLVGLLITITMSFSLRNTVPALPAAVVLGMLLYFAVAFFVTPTLSRHLVDAGKPIYV